eukprot:gb/GECG01005838.1/.p1 GENE.gb/GECG01005838.1/~~gb/GECG01005838.1/.p1  ORF type:complete len:271 (+),score=21.05 gb/GECG01005838.1/:1-813(+)
MWCGNWLKFAGKRDFFSHESAPLHGKNSPRSSSQSLTTLHHFIKDDKDATYRDRQLVAKSLAGLGLSLRTIECVTSPAMQAVTKQTGWISRKRACELLKSNDLEKREIAKRIEGRYLCLFLDDGKDERTNDQISVLQVHTLALNAPVTRSVSCHSDHSTVESLRTWIIGEFQSLQSQCRVLDKDVVALVTDNGTPVAGAANALIQEKLTSCERVPCVNDGLHLVAEHFLNELEEVVFLASSLKGWLEGQESVVKRRVSPSTLPAVALHSK